jgi:hypothetical protein
LEYRVKYVLHIYTSTYIIETDFSGAGTSGAAAVGWKPVLDSDDVAAVVDGQRLVVFQRDQISDTQAVANRQIGIPADSGELQGLGFKAFCFEKVELIRFGLAVQAVQFEKPSLFRKLENEGARMNHRYR